MKLIIDIPKEVKQAFDCAERNDLKGGYYDCGGVIGNAIRNGTPLEKHDEEVIKETVESIWGKPPYIELLDKIRVELHATAEMHEDNVYYLREEWIDEIINKYKMGG